MSEYSKAASEFSEAMFKRVEEVLSMLPEDEADQYRATLLVVGNYELKNGQKFFNESPPWISDSLKVLRSLHLRGLSLEGHEEALIDELRVWLHVDFVFFMGERWIRELFDKWLREGEQKKIERALFGVPRRGKRGYQGTVANHYRNIKIAARVSAYIKRGCAVLDAVNRTYDDLEKLGQGTSEQNIYKIYNEISAGKYPLNRILT